MKQVGVSRPIHDAGGKAAGHVKYTADVMLPNMAYISLLGSAIPHGNVKSINTQRAESLPGVYGVFHCFNTPQHGYNRYQSNALQDLPMEERTFKQYVRFVGDRIAAVAACDQKTADMAVKLIEVEYEALPHAVGFDDTLAGANCLPGQSPILDEFVANVGEAPTQEGLIEINSFSEMPQLHHAAMETHACVADYDPYSKMLTIYSPNQAVHGIRVVVSEYLGMPFHLVRVMKATMGGSFGAKQEWFLEPVAALIATKLSRPVKLVYTRSQSMTCAVARGAIRASTKSLFTPEGKLMSCKIDLVLDAGAYLSNGRDYVRALSGKPFRCYDIPHFEYHSQVISSNTPVSGAYRGWSAPEAAIILEHHMDIAAKTLGLDPIDIRVKNALLPWSIDRKNGVPLENIQIKNALLRGKEAFDWDKRMVENAEFNKTNPRYRRGIGVGCGGHGSTYYPRFNDYAEGRLFLNEDGTVQGSFTIHDHGCGTVTAISMIIGEVLDLPVSSICLLEGDTATTPIDFGCFASRTTYVIGRTAKDCATMLRDEILANASVLYNLPLEKLYVENGAVKCKDDQAFSATYRDVALSTMKKLRRNISVIAQFNNETNPGVTGVHLAFVEVDKWTGFTKVLDYLAIQDIGQAINPGMCIAQIQGAAQMGCGAALREKMTTNSQGHTTDSLSKYHVFLASDLPNIRVELLTDGTSQDGPFGAKSIGEVCYVPAAPAVCGAVNNALDSALAILPFDPDCILKYLAKEEEKC